MADGSGFKERRVPLSFSQDVKYEIIARRIGKPCCALAACYGAACFGKYFDAQGMVLHTEIPEAARLVQKLYHRVGIEGEIVQKERLGGPISEFSVKDPEQMARMMELFGHTGTEASLRINPAILQCSGCVSAFVSMAFLCSGTMTDPQKEYNLEFLTGRRNLARDFEALIAEHEFCPHRTVRKGANVIYVKASEPLVDLLTFMGAPKAAMQLMELKMVKDVRNKTNRIINCETANLSKMAAANAPVNKAVRYLEEHGDLAGLPEPLRQAAQVRLEQPDASLAQLAPLLDPPVSRSGLSHRFKRLQEIAETLRERREHG